MVCQIALLLSSYMLAYHFFSSLSKSLGIAVKMITSDKQAVALSNAKRLGMGTRVTTAKQINGEDHEVLA